MPGGFPGSIPGRSRRPAVLSGLRIGAVDPPRRARAARAARAAPAPVTGQQPNQPQPVRSDPGGFFICPFVSESCPAPGLEDRAKRIERRAAGSRIRGFWPETPGNRAILAELDALGHGNRARDRRETAFCAAKSRQQRAEPVPVQLEPRPLLNENRRTGLDPRAARRPRARPPATSSTEDQIFLPFFVVFARNCQKTAEPGREIWNEFSVKNRELAEIRQFCQIFFRIEDRVAPAAERFSPHGSPDRAGAPAYRVRSVALDHRIRARDPPGPHAPSRLQGPCF